MHICRHIEAHEHILHTEHTDRLRVILAVVFDTPTSSWMTRLKGQFTQITENWFCYLVFMEKVFVYLVRFGDIGLRAFCYHPYTMEVNQILIVVFKALKIQHCPHKDLVTPGMVQRNSSAHPTIALLWSCWDITLMLLFQILYTSVTRQHIILSNI